MTDMPTLIQQSRDALTEVQDNTALIQQNIGSASQDLLNATIATRDWLQTLVDRLEEVLAQLDVYIAALNEPSDVQGYEDALALFGITLAPSGGTSDPDGWGKIERIRNAYRAVNTIIMRLAREASGQTDPDDDAKVEGILRFIDAFGKTELNLVSGFDAQFPKAAAITTLADRDLDASHSAETGVISLYTLPKDNNGNTIPNFVHTTENIVHEFGHVLELRTTGSLYQEWQTIRNQFGRNIICEVDENGDPVVQITSTLIGFNIDEGWNVAFRQNTFDLADFDPDCVNPTEEEMCDEPEPKQLKDSLCLLLEIERIADMFLFWVYKNDPNYAFDTSSDRGQAMENFTNGVDWTRGGVLLDSSGFLYWVEQAAELKPV